MKIRGYISHKSDWSTKAMGKVMCDRIIKDLIIIEIRTWIETSKRWHFLIFSAMVYKCSNFLLSYSVEIVIKYFLIFFLPGNNKILREGLKNRLLSYLFSVYFYLTVSAKWYSGKKRSFQAHFNVK